jgi:hypothetical protein
MVSNLMNFIGSSLSFVMPTLVVAQRPKSIEDSRQQIGLLMRYQLATAVFSFFLTALLYQPSPAVPVLTAHRKSVPFLTEVRGFLRLRDFWLVNGQFMIYVAVCHAFDAVEGSLLEHYGYNASLASWTAVACAVSSIASTIVEASYITDPASYRSALVIVNVILAASQLFGCISLYFQFHEAAFVIAVAVMGLSTPGWGCTFELGSEVCFPAREATVSSIMEACSNLVGVAGIVLMQRLIDAGFGAGVLLLMAILSLAGGAMLLGLSGRLRRSEAEKLEAEIGIPQELESFVDGIEDDGCTIELGNASGDDKNYVPAHRRFFVRLRNASSRWSLRLGKAWPGGVVHGYDASEFGCAASCQDWVDSSLWVIPSAGL